MLRIGLHGHIYIGRRVPARLRRDDGAPGGLVPHALKSRSGVSSGRLSGSGGRVTGRGDPFPRPAAVVIKPTDGGRSAAELLRMASCGRYGCGFYACT